MSAPLRVLVVGGSAGIGLATARRALEAGAEVTIASRSRARLDAAADTLGPGRVQTAVLDATDDPAVQAFFAGRAAWSCVVVTGSSTRSGPARALPLEDARAAMDSKFWSAYHVGRHARFVEGGSLTLVSGVYSVRAVPDAVLQGAINAAIEALARGLALELAPVRVNTVSPSTTDTPLWDKLGPEGRARKFEAMAGKLPVGRVAGPAEIADAIWFLANNGFATGTTLLVDGGDALV